MSDLLTQSFRFADPRDLADLRTFATRAKSIDDGAIRLQAAGPVLAAFANAIFAATGTRDPVLTRRAAAEREQIERVRHDLAGRLAIVPWMPAEPIGPAALEALVAPSGAAGSEVAA